MLVAGIEVPVAEAPVASHDPSIPVDEPIVEVDVEIRVYSFLDEEGERLVEMARKASEILSKDYGILAIVVPVTIFNCLGLCIGEAYPRLVINGHPIQIDDNNASSLDVDTLVHLSLALLYKSGEYGLLPTGKPSDNKLVAASMVAS